MTFEEMLKSYARDFDLRIKKLKILLYNFLWFYENYNYKAYFSLYEIENPFTSYPWCARSLKMIVYHILLRIYDLSTIKAHASSLSVTFAFLTRRYWNFFDFRDENKTCLLLNKKISTRRNYLRRCSDVHWYRMSRMTTFKITAIGLIRAAN